MLPRMVQSELLEDVEAETKPECQSGIRRKNSSSAFALESLADHVISELEKRPLGRVQHKTGFRPVKEHILDLRKVRDEFRSWQLSPPTPEVRRQKTEHFLALHVEATEYLLARPAPYSFVRNR